MCRKITSHWQPLFSKKMVAAVSFFYKIGGGSKDLATLLAVFSLDIGFWVIISNFNCKMTPLLKKKYFWKKRRSMGTVLAYS